MSENQVAPNNNVNPLTGQVMQPIEEKPEFVPTNAVPAPIPTAQAIPAGAMAAVAPGGAGGYNDPDEDFTLDSTEGDSPWNVPDGKYRARCIEVAKQTSKAGNPMFVWTFVISEGQYSGKEFRSYTVTTGAGKFKATETAAALGLPVTKQIDPTTGVEIQIFNFKRSDAINRECDILMENKPDNNGNMRSNIQKCMKVG